MVYSQNNEQEYILNYFKSDTGRFLDIGAYDGITFSNVRALIDKGWTGVMVEGSPQVFAKLQSNTIGLNVELCHAVIVTGSEGLIQWYDNADATSTHVESNRVKWEKKTPFRSMNIMSCNVKRLVETYGTDFDMVNIDVEGSSVDIFKELVKLMPDVRLWCVEHDGLVQEVRSCLSGFSILYQNGENILLGRK